MTCLVTPTACFVSYPGPQTCWAEGANWRRAANLQQSALSFLDLENVFTYGQRKVPLADVASFKSMKGFPVLF